MQKIVTTLWFDDEAEEAANYYCSIFKDSEITNISYYGEAGPREKGKVLTVDFKLHGQAFIALNGGPADFKFDESISFLVNCESQDEVDEYWERLLADGGEPSQCGWLKDKFGVSWQIIPTALPRLLQQEDSAAANRVMEAMLKMVKIEIAELEAAAKGA